MDRHGAGELSARPTATVDADRVRELRTHEEELFAERTTASRELFERAAHSLAGGVTSSFHGTDPWALYIAHGEGAHVWDVDGNEYLDFHNGFSAMVQGHAHPAIVAAVQEQVTRGTHFGATTELTVAVAEELARRFGLAQWRFTNSGTESNMAAIRLARAASGRLAVIRMERSYHGHAEIEPAAEVLFNDAEALDRAIEEVRPACVLMEGAMTSGGLTPPEPGYLEAVRELTRRHGVLLVFDEVKTGLTIAAGGAVERFGVTPDIVTLAKSLGGGLPSGAIGMTHELAELIADGRVRQLGTYNGNPLSMAAASASLRQVLTPAAYDELERLGDRMVTGCDELIAAAALEASCVGVGSKGAVDWGGDLELGRLIWLWLANRGVYTTAGRQQEWNVSVAHDEDTVDRYLDLIGALAAELTPRSSGSARA
jgi:glutamate-1-semialdehyde 2,1-aminomutase